MEERILVYKDAEAYESHKRYYGHVLESLQEISDAVKSLGLTPDMDLLRNLVRGKDMSKSIFSKITSGDMAKYLPGKMIEMLNKSLFESFDTDYRQKVEKPSMSLKNSLDNSGYGAKLNFFEVENGTVVLSPDYEKDLEEIYCTFVQTDGQRKIYEKYLLFEEAARELNKAIEEAEQIQDEDEHVFSLVSRGRICAFGSVDNGSCLVYLYGGELKLRGYNFSRFL